MKYRKKPIEVEAIQWDGISFSNLVERLADYEPECVAYNYRDDSLYIQTLEGDMKVNVGDYIIKGINGEIYPCKPDIFEKSYEKV